MTANPTLPLPRLPRHPSWFLPLLLPVLPALAGWWSTAPHRPHGSELLVLLLALGATLTFGGAAWIDHLGWAARKEIGLLRTPWLASVFLCQIPLLFGPELEDLAAMLFFASSALVAAIPFGAEFQQRTLAAMLSQPIRRQDWWRLKNGILAGALACHALLFLTAAVATGLSPTPPQVLALLGGTLLLGATTPWWTLLTRSLLSGLVLALAVPLGTLFVLLTGIDALDRYLGWIDTDRGGFWILTLTLGLGSISYLLAARIDGQRRWTHLEAQDSPLAEASALTRLGAWHWSSPDQSASRSRTRLGWRFSTELRLLALPVALACLTVVLGLLRIATRDLLLLGDYAAGTVILVAVTGVLLAGALPISEERRLGTLEALLLQPVPSARIWWGKLALAGGLASAIAIVAAGSFPDRIQLADTTQLVAAGLVVTVLFCSAFLASSLCASALRALVTGVGVAAVTLGLLGAAPWLVATFEDQASEEWRARALHQPEQLMSEVRQMPDEELAALESIRAGNGLPIHVAVLVGSLGAGAAIPGLLALVFARLNFVRPNLTPRRALLQIGACVSLTLAASAVAILVSRNGTALNERARMIGRVRDTLAWESQLSPGERLLWQQHRSGPPLFTHSVQVRIDPAVNPRPSQPSLEAYLPLQRFVRRYLLDHGQLSEEIRQLLRHEDAQDPRPLLDLPPIPDIPGPPPRWRATPPEEPTENLPPGFLQRPGQQLPTVPPDPDPDPDATPL